MNFHPVRISLGLLLLIGSLLISTSQAQTTAAVVNGLVLDASGGVVPGATVDAINNDTNIVYPSKTNHEGVYSITNLPPGQYHLQVSKTGFKTLIKPDLTLHIQDAIAINFTLAVGATSETITVKADISPINTESGAVSTVVDHKFVEDIPLNGRSFQNLIALTPGVVLTSAGFQDPGQFSVNGQRASANYFTIDGVSANIGSGVEGFGQSAGGAMPGFSVLGGTNNLVSVDAMQEFRIQTSSYAPEFGRTPGGQIAIVTRPGTNRFHGDVFDYFRNDALDANNWFANANQLSKPKDRQNDFGGVLGGPILKDKMFFFFSYEGLRLQVPQTLLTTVPDLASRQAASPSVQPYLNAFPLPQGPALDSSGNPIPQQGAFNGSFSNQSALNATSLRIDYAVNDKLNIFGRYNYSPSNLLQRGLLFTTLNTLTATDLATQTLTFGVVWSISNAANNDFHFNYSRNDATSAMHLDTFGGATVPSDSALFPAPYTSKNSAFTLSEYDLSQGFAWSQGKGGNNLQRQINFTDSFSLQKGTHALKFGADYRRLTPRIDPATYVAEPQFYDPTGGISLDTFIEGEPEFIGIGSNVPGTLALQDLGLFAQDTWKATSRLTLTYGIRWEFEPPPSSPDSSGLLAVTNFNDQNLNTLALAPLGASLWQTRYENFAPRLGAAYVLSQDANHETVLRGGFGVFYDLATTQIGDAFGGTFPFGSFEDEFSSLATGTGSLLTLPMTAAESTPLPIAIPSPTEAESLTAVDPHLRMPYTLQWNFAIEQSLGSNQTISATYVGAAGRRLLQSAFVAPLGADFSQVQVIEGEGTSDYNALQIQFQRRMSAGLQVLASYTWSHSIDTASSSSLASNENGLGINPNINRGPSDFDIRDQFSGALTYEIPSPRNANPIVRSILKDWSADNFIIARTATPFDVIEGFSFLGSAQVYARPDLDPHEPIYISDPAPGVPYHIMLDPYAFLPPPIDPNTGLPREGDLGRNAIRGFNAFQWDFAIRRQFNITERFRLQFRGEFFNVLNHPNFANPNGSMLQPNFGISTMTLAQALGGTSPGAGGFNPLYQIGGPRSIQLAMKLTF